MTSLAVLGQIALAVTDADRSQAFYRSTLGLPFLFRYGPLVFFDCNGVRLMLDGGGERVKSPHSGCLYFRTSAIESTRDALRAGGVTFDDEPHLIARMPDHELWMTFFKDPDGNQLALMEERR